jgi:hypothetical protein
MRCTYHAVSTGAMVFGRVHVGRVKFGHLKFGRTLNGISHWHPAVWSRLNSLIGFISSEVSVWSRHLCLVMPLPMFRAYNKVSKSGLRFALAALVSELLTFKV